MSSSTTTSLLGEQFLTSSQMHEKLRLAISVLRNQPNRWFSLTQLDQEVGCGVLLVKFPLNWREYLLQHCSVESPSLIKCRYTNFAIHKKPTSANSFEMQYTAPFFRDGKDLMKQLKYLYLARNSKDDSSSSSRNNNCSSPDAAIRSMKDDNNNNENSSNLRCLAVDSLAVGNVRATSLHVIQQCIDKDWVYVVQAVKPTKKSIMLSNNNRTDEDTDLSKLLGAEKTLPKRRQRERKDDEDCIGGGGGGGGNTNEGGGEDGGGGNSKNTGGGGGSSSMMLSSSSLQEASNVIGGRGLCSSLYQNHYINTFISTRILNATVTYPVGRFLSDVLTIPSTGPQLQQNQNQNQQQGNNRQDTLIDQLKRLQDGFWDINLSRDFSENSNTSILPDKRISLVCDPPGSCFIFPGQLICSNPLKNNNNSSSASSSAVWRGAFRLVPLKEGKIDLRLTVQEITTSKNQNQNQQQLQTNFSSRVQVKKRFPVDDQSLYRNPPLLFYRGIGSTSILSALGMSDPNSTSNQQKQKSTSSSSSLYDGRVIANSVKRMLEPVPSIMQSVAAGAVVDVGASSAGGASKLKEEDLRNAEAFCFAPSSVATTFSMFSSSSSSSNNANTISNSLALEREARMIAREKHVDQILNSKNPVLGQQENTNNKKDNSSKKSTNGKGFNGRELKFSNAHMLHLGIDTRKPFYSNKKGGGGNDDDDDESYPLESMDV